MANIIKYHHISTSAVSFSEDSLFPIDGSAEEARNFCRNLDNDNVPWCYTSDKYRRWDYCDLQITQGAFCLSVSLSVCLSVCLYVCMCVCQGFCLSVCLSQCLSVSRGGKNICRNLDTDNVPWCYNNDKYRRWDYFDLQITKFGLSVCVYVCLSVCLSKL